MRRMVAMARVAVSLAALARLAAASVRSAPGAAVMVGGARRKWWLKLEGGLRAEAE